MHKAICEGDILTNISGHKLKNSDLFAPIHKKASLHFLTIY